VTRTCVLLAVVAALFARGSTGAAGGLATAGAAAVRRASPEAVSPGVRALRAAHLAKSPLDIAQALRLLGEAHQQEEDQAVRGELRKAALDMAASLSGPWVADSMSDVEWHCSGWCGVGCFPLIVAVLGERAGTQARKMGYWGSAATFEYDGLRARWYLEFEPRPVSLVPLRCGATPEPTPASSCQTIPDLYHEPLEIRDTRAARATTSGALLRCLQDLPGGAFIHVSFIVGRSNTLCWHRVLAAEGLDDERAQCVRQRLAGALPGLALEPGHHSLVLRH
jgi:hypothetical protein